MNVNIVDKEKAEKNVELKKKKPEYKPYNEEESVDDMVMVSSPFRFTDHISVYQFKPFLRCLSVGHVRTWRFALERVKKMLITLSYGFVMKNFECYFLVVVFLKYKTKKNFIALQFYLCVVLPLSRIFSFKSLRSL